MKTWLTSGAFWRWRNAVFADLISLRIVPSTDIVPELTPDGTRLRIQKPDAQDYDASELAVSISGTTITVSEGQLVLGQRVIYLAEVEINGSTPSFITPESTGIENHHWFFYQVHAEDPYGTGNEVGGITESDVKAVDDFTGSNRWIRINLGLYRRTATTWAFVRRARPELHQHGIISG